MSDVRIVFLTALNLEYGAVRRRLVDVRAHHHPQGTRFEIGRLAGTTVRAAVALVGKGNHPTAVLAERAMAEFSPQAVIFVGVAGALRAKVSLGDVVVATQVYAYHGGTSEDDGLKARPRAWEAPHEAVQVAHSVDLAGAWAGSGSTDGQGPRVLFGPIAAGEVVQDSAVCEQARWMRQHYNDALAIDMEAAGVAQAGHLNKGLPVIVVRGISDRADGTKTETDAGNWQPRAVANAAAFAAALAVELSENADAGSRGIGPSAAHRFSADDRSSAGDRYTSARPADRSADRGTGARWSGSAASATNIASGGSRVGVQAGQVCGDVRVGFGSEPDTGPGLSGQLAALRRLLRQAHVAGDVDDATYTAAEAELGVITSYLADGRRRSDGGGADQPQADGAVMVALKRLRGLVADVADLAAKVTAVVTAVRGRS